MLKRGLICVLVFYSGLTCVFCQVTCPPPRAGSKDPQRPRFLDISVPAGDKCKDFKLFLAAYVSEPDTPEFCTLATSALAFGFELNVLGLERSDQRKEFGGVDKFRALQEFVKPLPENSVILFVGSTHALFTGTPEALLLSFLETGKDILFSAAKDCCMAWWASVESLHRKQQLRCDDKYAHLDAHTRACVA